MQFSSDLQTCQGGGGSKERERERESNDDGYIQQNDEVLNA